MYVLGYIHVRTDIYAPIEWKDNRTHYEYVKLSSLLLYQVYVEKYVYTICLFGDVEGLIMDELFWLT